MIAPLEGPDVGYDLSNLNMRAERDILIQAQKEAPSSSIRLLKEQTPRLLWMAHMVEAHWREMPESDREAFLEIETLLDGLIQKVRLQRPSNVFDQLGARIHCLLSGISWSDVLDFAIALVTLQSTIRKTVLSSQKYVWEKAFSIPGFADNEAASSPGKTYTKEEFLNCFT
jgi:hypothetical protein